MCHVPDQYGLCDAPGRAEDLDLGEDWYKKKAEDTVQGRYRILYNPVFRRVVLIGLAVSMAAAGIVLLIF